MPAEISDALARATGALEESEHRPGQERMAEAVAAAIRTRRHLIVAAGTGTGKSLAYLVPALVSGARVVVATATKALQDQLATRDLPLLAEHLGVPFEFAVLKGRANYLCRQRAMEIAGGDELPLDGAASAGPLGREVRRLLEWSVDAEVGDRADLPFEPTPRAWAQVSVGRAECPGAARCPAGDGCFAEAARQRAGQADVVVVNTHLYAAHLLSGGGVLPPHDVVVIDEAHALEDIASASLGFELTSGRIRALARLSRPLVVEQTAVAAVDDAADRLAVALGAWRGRRLTEPIDDELAGALTLTRERISAMLGAVRRSEVDAARRSRALEAGGHLLTDLDTVLALPDGLVAWGAEEDRATQLNVAPLDVGARLDELWWSAEDPPTAVLTSATIPPRLAERLGLPAGSYDELDVGSPFDFPNHALLYCARHLPDPRSPDYEAAMHEELVGLIDAAGGRTLALFTSWRAMRAAAEGVSGRLAWPVLTQSDLPKPALVARFRAEEQSCLFATMGFWQGVDVPGPALSLVVLDRIPFPRPDDPLLQARRDRLGRTAFATIDLPRAATLLAQGAGRLIRGANDRGVVAILDPRLSTARYGWELVGALPPMGRTRNIADVSAWLAPVRARPLVAQPLQGTRPALPVLVHPHDQLEVDARGQLLANPGADLLQDQAALADHHAPLAVALHEDLTADPRPLPFGDAGGDRVRELLARHREQLLPHQLGDPHRFGRIAHRVVGIQLRPFGKAPHDRRHQRVDALAGTGGHGKVVVQVQLARGSQTFQGLGRRRHVQLVGHADRMGREALGHEAIPFPHLPGRVEDQHRHVHARQRGGGGVVEPLPQQRAGLVDPGRVHEHDLGGREVEDAPHRMAGGLHLVRHDRHLLTEDGVQQRRLAHVGPSHQRGEARSHPPDSAGVAAWGSGQIRTRPMRWPCTRSATR